MFGFLISFLMLQQGNLYAGGRLLYRLCSCQPTVEMAVGALENIFLLLINNQAQSWLTTAHVIPSLSKLRQSNRSKLTNQLIS